MTASKNPRPPKYRRQRGGSHDRAFVEIDGVRCYLGRYDSPESRQAYHRLVAEYLAAGGSLPAPPQQATVVELLNGFRKHAERRYRRADGSLTSEMDNYRSLLRLVNRLYGDTLVKDFSPRTLKALRHVMVHEMQWSRRYVNRQVVRLRTIFKWGVSEGLVPPDVLHALASVDGLRAGTTDAVDHPAVQPVTQEQIDAVLARVPPVIADMIQVQLLTGMRPGELCAMKPSDLDMSGDIWIYRPATHKTTYRGRDRWIAIGPRAQSLLRPYLTGRPINAHVFSPVDAERQRRDARHAARTTPLSCGNRPGSNRVKRRTRRRRDHYDTATYARAIRYACEAAWPHPTISKIPPRKRSEQQAAELEAWNKAHRWSPNQLRHTAATRIRSEVGLELSRAVLGHSTLSITEQFYAELDRDKVSELMKRIG